MEGSRGEGRRSYQPWINYLGDGRIACAGHYGGDDLIEKDYANYLMLAEGSPEATLWAVYELVERWGAVFSYQGDVLPVKQPDNIGRKHIPTGDFITNPEFIHFRTFAGRHPNGAGGGEKSIIILAAEHC